MLFWVILRIFFEHLLLLCLVRVNFIVLRQNIVFDIRSISFLRSLSKTWRHVVILINLVSWDSTRGCSTLNFDLRCLNCAYFLVLTRIFGWLSRIWGNLVALFTLSSFILLILLLWFLAHLWHLRVVSTRRTCRVIYNLIWSPWLIILVLSIREHFWIVLILGLIKLILIPTWSILFLRIFLSSGCISHLCQVVYRITSRVPRILLLTTLCSHVLINKIVLFFYNPLY